MFRDTTVETLTSGGVCDSILLKPPTFTNNYNSIMYNFRSGDGNGLTTYTTGGVTYTYNKYRTVDVKDFFNDILNKNYTHDISKCDNAVIDPENCFTFEVDKCKYSVNTSSETYNIIASNIAKREIIRTAISNTNTELSNITNDIKDLLTSETQALIDNDIVRAAGRSIEQIYPEISNINNQITTLINENAATEKSIERVDVK